MIEVLLAMGIIVVGLIGVMGLIPVGLSANRDAIAKNYSADGAEQLLNQIAAQLKEDWSALDNYGKQPVDISAGAGDISTWVQIPGTNLWHKDYDPDPMEVELAYRIYQQSDVGTSGARLVTDFDAMLRIWKSSTQAWEYDSGWTMVADNDFEQRVQLNVEISWPTALKFEHRKKAYYVMEVARK